MNIVGLRRGLLRAGFTSLDLLSPILHEVFGLGPSRYELESLLGFSPAQSRRAAWGGTALAAKNFNLRRLLRRGGSPILEGLVGWARPPEQLHAWQQQGQAVLLLGWHAGPPFALAQALSQAGLSALFCVGPAPNYRLPPGIDYVATDGGAACRAEALHRAVQHLRQGKTVYLLADHPYLSSRRVSMLGREVSLSPSLGMLARLSRAHLVPVTARWLPGGRIQVEAYPGRLGHKLDEESLYSELAAFFEHYLVTHPGELEEKFVAKLLFGAPEV